jgi:hypothetical protein
VGVVFVLVTVIVVVAIGLVSVGAVTARLAAAPPRTLFDLGEAVDYVADRLGPDAAGQVTYDELQQLLGWHLDYLEGEGVAAEDDDPVPAGAPAAPAVAADDEGLAYVLGRAAEAGIDVDDVAVAEVLEAAGAYLAAIGAVGHQVAPHRPENGV